MQKHSLQEARMTVQDILLRSTSLPSYTILCITALFNHYLPEPSFVAASSLLQLPVTAYERRDSGSLTLRSHTIGATYYVILKPNVAYVDRVNPFKGHLWRCA